jgi:predicted TPR repeat methyltransferase
VYFGELAPLFRQIRAALRPGGLFVFSVETKDGDGYALTPANRYAHAPAYVEAVARSAGFALLAETPATLRREHGLEVAGRLVLLRAAG